MKKPSAQPMRAAAGRPLGVTGLLGTLATTITDHTGVAAADIEHYVTGIAITALGSLFASINRWIDSKERIALAAVEDPAAAIADLQAQLGDGAEEQAQQAGFISRLGDDTAELRAAITALQAERAERAAAPDSPDGWEDEYDAARAAAPDFERADPQGQEWPPA